MLAVGRKSITTIQDGSVYQDTWPASAGTPWPVGATARQDFYDSSGAVIVSVDAVSVTPRLVTFQAPYADIATVPNGAGFQGYVTDADGDHMVRYGTVFRRQLFFGDSPAISAENLPRAYGDDFQRPAGPVGGRWKNLVGAPIIMKHSSGLPNTVGPNFNLFQSYFTRYYTPFNGDTIALAISLVNLGQGKGIIALSCNSDASSYLYVGWDGVTNKIDLGYGTGPNIGIVGIPSGVLHPQGTPVSHPISVATMERFVIYYNAVTKSLSVWNADRTTKYLEWVDSSDLVPHGKGHRYFAIGGNTSLIFSGIQCAYINAQDAV